MEEQVLKNLRRKQIVLQNIAAILSLTVTGILCSFIKSINTFFYLGGAICLSCIIIVVLNRKYGEIKGLIVPSLKPLYAYEHEKLGVEYSKLRKRELIILVILTIFMFYLGIITPHNHQLIYGRTALYYFLPGALMSFIASNISFYKRIKKIDESNAEELNGYANEILINGIMIGIFGVILVGVALVLLVSYLFLRI